MGNNDTLYQSYVWSEPKLNFDAAREDTELAEYLTHLNKLGFVLKIIT